MTGCKDDLLVKAAHLARKNGYYDLPQSELLEKASSIAGQVYESMKRVRQVHWRLGAGHHTKNSIQELSVRADGVMDDAEDIDVEWFAVTEALTPDNRRAHDHAMRERYGDGWFVGGV